MKRAGNFMLPDVDTYFAPFLEQGGFQLDHLHDALHYVKNFDFAVDGGAHVGSWAIEMSKVFRKVLAFEPAEDTFKCLQHNTQGYTTIELVQQALGNTGQSFGRVVDDISRFGNTGSRFMQVDDAGPIKIHTLDAFDLEGLDFLKLDVEGFEYYALLGAEKTIRKYRPTILVEEKGFGRRYDLQPMAASNLLISWGAICMAQMGKDFVFSF